MCTSLKFLFDESEEIDATVTEVMPTGAFEVDHRPSVILSETNLQYERPDRFSDHGWVNDQKVVAVHRLHNGDVVHHFDGGEPAFRMGDRVRVRVDRGWRNTQSRLLCVGRLIEMIGPIVVSGFKVVNSDYRPHRAKIEFGHPEFIPTDESVSKSFLSEVERLLDSELPISVSPIADGPFVYVTIGDFERFKCTSLYPKNLSEIGCVRISRIVAIGGRLQVRFGLI